MSYQVWTKGDYDGWSCQECQDMEAAQSAILLALKAGKEPMLTTEVPFGVTIWIKEVNPDEAAQTKIESN